jgi:hypothetical protein
MPSNYFESLVINEIDSRSAKSNDQVEKLILELFKTAILKKYKMVYDYEILNNVVRRDSLDKCVDFLFTNTCKTLRRMPNMDDATKDEEIEAGLNHLDSIKMIVAMMLNDRGISVI